MRWVAGLIVLNLCLLTRAAPAPSTQTSTDGTSYGELGEQKIKPEQMPMIGTALGNPPAALVQKRAVYAAGTDPADQLIKSTLVARRLTIQYPSQFYTKGTNSSLLGFDVDAGRVIAVTLYYQNDRNRPDDHTLEGYRAGLKRINEHATVSALMSTPPDAHVLSIRYSIVDWYLANHQTTPEITAAMRDRRPIVGMTEFEGGATLSHLSQLESTENGQGKIVIYGKYETTPDRVVDGNTIPGEVVKQRIWQITYRGGRVVEVTKL